jgi:DNA-binding beta-propeller fold protein YncE
LANFSFTSVLQGLGNLRSVAFSPSGSEAYVAGDPIAGLRIIDVASNTVTGTIGPVNGQPRDIDVDSAGIVYLSTDAGIYAIDPVGKVILDKVDISYVLYLDLHPVLPLIYASELQLGRLRELSTTTLDITRTYQPGGNPVADLAVSDDGATLYSADEGSGVVTFIELATGNPSYFPIGCTSRTLLAVHQSSELYVSCSTFGGVNVLDTATGTVVKGVSVSVAGQMAQSKDGLSIVIPGSDGQILLLQ